MERLFKKDEVSFCLGWLLSVLLMLSACSGDYGGNNKGRPVFIRTNPVNGQTGVAPSIVIRAAFDQDMLASSINTSSFTLNGPSGNITGTVLYDGKYKSASFTPSTPLLLFTSYTANLASTILDSHGYTIPGYSWTFTTGSGGWGAAQLLETDNAGAAINPQIAADKTGNAMAVWQQSDGTRNNIWASYYSAGSGWGTPVKIETDDFSDATSPRLAFDVTGNATVVWQQMETAASFINIWSNRYEPGTGWAGAEKIEFLEIADATNPDVAVDPSGNAFAVWQMFDGSYQSIYAVRYIAGTGWQTAGLIDSNIGDASKPKVVMDGSGNAIAAWYQTVSVYNTIQANRYTAGSWGTDITISGGANHAYDPKIAVDSNGNAHAVWYEFDGLRNNIWANFYIAGGAWQTASLIETDDIADATSPDIAIDPSDNAITVWVQSDGTYSNVWSNRYIAGSSWGIAELIETDNTGNAYVPDIAFDSGGNAIAVWFQSDGSRDNIHANRYSAGIGWGTAGVIETENLGFAQYPQIAFDSNGKGIAVWYQSDGVRDNIWTNDYTAP